MKKFKIAFLGLGKTGKVVAQNIHLDDRFELVFALKNKVDKSDKFDFKVKSKKHLNRLIEKHSPDVVVDFSTAEAVLSTIEKLPPQTPYIIATTGFTADQLEKLKEYPELTVLYAPCISDGINLLIEACKVFNKSWHDADVEIIEQHSKHKKDWPSGTAKKIATTFNKDIPIHSVRAGDIVSYHEVVLAVNNQKITLTHESFNKEVFAEGVKKAVSWLADKPCGYYEVDEVYR
ncbi:MAG: dihydrodipicolinate reductase C-terminal domain-containing protein [Methylococcales bacterium]|nr:dihydrodipicolinate reductase C-terminal domain-containing protein [Methylococcales bacterium]